MITCLRPKLVFNKYLREYVSVPCGECCACRSLRSSQWATRLEQESLSHKYTLFVTLTYYDSILPCVDVRSISGDDSFRRACADSKEFLTLHHGKVPCVRSSDIQKFFKRLRINLQRKLNIYNETRFLRYFVAAEYGPTTFRPHYHMLVWFDLPQIAETIKECIYKAWDTQDYFPSLSAFCERNHIEYVTKNAARYVAGYLCCTADLPSILYHKPFRVFHLASKQPPIGTLRIQQETLKQIQSGNLYQITIDKPLSNSNVSVSLWRCLENKFLPKCLGFSSLAHSDRVALYRLYYEAGCPENFKAFTKWLCSQWFSSHPSVQLCKDVARIKPCVEYKGLSDENRGSLRRMFYTSRRVCELAFNAKQTLSQYVSCIEKYYNGKEMLSLKRQLEYEEELSKNPRLGSLSDYLLMLDLNVTNNGRKLKNLDSYLAQFGLSDVVDSDFTRLKDYKNKRSLYDTICFENSKTRRRKDYISVNPQYQSIYQSILKPY